MQRQIELYLDEDVDVLIADLLRPRRFAVTTTHEVKRNERTDAQQLEFAVANQKTLLTHNRQDFEQLAREYFEAERMHYGIIIAVRRSPYEIARRVLKILNTTTAEEMKNQLIYI